MLRLLAIVLALVLSVRLQQLDNETSIEEQDINFPCSNPYIVCDAATNSYKVCSEVWGGGHKIKVFLTKTIYSCQEGYLCNDGSDGAEFPCKKDPAVTTEGPCPEITTTQLVCPEITTTPLVCPEITTPEIPTTEPPTTQPPTTTTTTEAPPTCAKPDCPTLQIAGVHCGPQGQYYECVYIWWWWETYQNNCSQCQTQECKDLSSCKSKTPSKETGGRTFFNGPQRN